MCGIVGYISKEKKDIHLALDEIHHRGPDAWGCEEFLEDDFNIAIGHKRLSIIDLNPESNQPFYSKCKNYMIVFNGEIYNYLKLRSQLEDEGVSFNTKGDTEVLLNWMIYKGESGLEALEGMFAFAFYDIKYKNLLLVRDALGIKPLYYSIDKENLFFASEIKAIFAMAPEKKIIDSELISEYLLTTFIYEPETGFKDVVKVKPGYLIKIELASLDYKEYKYIDIYKKTKNHSVQNALDDISRNINSHMAADVPIGLFFSGGVDSSVILSKTKNKIQNLTVKSNESRYKSSGVSSDYYYAKKIANIYNANLSEIDLDKHINSVDEFLNSINTVGVWNEELNCDFTFISSFLLSSAARENNLVVMQSGMGADEIFGGYDRYMLVHFSWIFKLFLPFAYFLKFHPSYSKKMDRFKTFFDEKSFALKYSSLIGYFSKKEVKGLCNSESGISRFEAKLTAYLVKFKNKSNLKKAMGLDSLGFLSHNFMVADKSSMKASIEMRVPLATKSLFQITWNLKDSELLKFNNSKRILKDLLLSDIPKKMIHRKKAGFNAPLDNYINQIGLERYLDEISKTKIYNYLDELKLKSIVRDHYSGQKNNTYKLYQILHLSKWILKYD